MLRPMNNVLLLLDRLWLLRLGLLQLPRIDECKDTHKPRAREDEAADDGAEEVHHWHRIVAWRRLRRRRRRGRWRGRWWRRRRLVRRRSRRRRRLWWRRRWRRRVDQKDGALIWRQCPAAILDFGRRLQPAAVGVIDADGFDPEDTVGCRLGDCLLHRDGPEDGEILQWIDISRGVW